MQHIIIKISVHMAYRNIFVKSSYGCVR